MRRVFLDLDGTLTDPGVGITRCIAHALERLGFPVPSAATLAQCVGPPLAESFRALLATDDEALVRSAIELYRERFGPVGMFENEVYPGIPEALGALVPQGVELRVVTSKPTVFAERIVEHFDLAKYLSSVHGSELDGTRTDKAELIRHVLSTGAIAPDAAIMVGDRKHDIVGAQRNDVPAIGVLWGYGSQDELSRARPIAILGHPRELPAALGRATKRPTEA
jgi:phosphoglycolate phosphatase